MRVPDDYVAPLAALSCHRQHAVATAEVCHIHATLGQALSHTLDNELPRKEASMRIQLWYLASSLATLLLKYKYCWWLFKAAIATHVLLNSCD